MNILITGMHRSGTSMLARILQILGFYFGEPETLLPPRPSNPEGFWERLDVMRINNQILSTGQASWDWPRNLPFDFWEKGKATYHAKWMVEAELLLQYLDKHSPWAIKDPRFCLTLSFWRELAPHAKYLVCMRNPLEVAQSLSKRHRVTENFGIQLWLAYYENLLKDSQENQRLVVDYRMIMESPEKQLERLIAWLGITPEEQAISDALAAIKSSCWHHRINNYLECMERPRFMKIKETYEKLSKEAELEGQITSGENHDYLVSLSSSNSGVPRNVIIHYHLYKNAGSSVDKNLQNIFGGVAWIKWEGDGGRASPSALAELIKTRPEVCAISSHVADICPPVITGIKIFPIIFLRHPLARVSSVYHFERGQQKDVLSANQAKKLDFKSYVEWRLSSDFQFKNFQTRRLAAWASSPEDRALPILTRALKALSELPFFGLVERFGESIACLEEWLKPYFMNFKCQSLRTNSTSESDASLEDNLNKLREQLGEALYFKLIQENNDDLVLYDAAVAAWLNRLR